LKEEKFRLYTFCRTWIYKCHFYAENNHSLWIWKSRCNKAIILYLLYSYLLYLLLYFTTLFTLIPKKYTKFAFQNLLLRTNWTAKYEFYRRIKYLLNRKIRCCKKSQFKNSDKLHALEKSFKRNIVFNTYK